MFFAIPFMYLLAIWLTDSLPLLISATSALLNAILDAPPNKPPPPASLDSTGLINPIIEIPPLTSALNCDACCGFNPLFIACS
jgi:hypothetical protein